MSVYGVTEGYGALKLYLLWPTNILDLALTAMNKTTNLNE